MTLIFRSQLLALLVGFFESLPFILVVVINIWHGFELNLLALESYNEPLALEHFLLNRNFLKLGFFDITVAAIVERVIADFFIDFFLFSLFGVEFKGVIMPALDNHLRK